MAEITGKWKLDKSDNFDNFLKELGVNFMMRKMANTSSPTVEISRSGDEFEFKTTTALKTSVVKFTLGQEFEEERLDGKKVRSVMTLEGNKLVQSQRDDGKEVTYVREFNGDTLTVVSPAPRASHVLVSQSRALIIVSLQTSTANGVSCVRVYKRIQ